MILSQSALQLVILTSSSILTCHSQIKLTPCLNFVIFISETFVVCVISFFLQLQLRQTWLLLQFTLQWHFASKLDQNTAHTKYSGSCRYKYTKIWTHYTNTQQITLASNQTTNWLQTCLLTFKPLQIQQPTYLYNSFSFPFHSLSTKSSDSSVLSIPYVRTSLG